jgi:hypothetical protein
MLRFPTVVASHASVLRINFNTKSIRGGLLVYLLFSLHTLSLLLALLMRNNLVVLMIRILLLHLTRERWGRPDLM